MARPTKKQLGIKDNELPIQPTGKGRLIIELAGVGPMVFNWDNPELNSKLLQLIVDGQTFDVNAYNKTEEKMYKKLLAEKS